MREYIHLFENSGLRDAYESGRDYTEPYVSYTPVINEYKAQFNGETINVFKVKKIQGGYKVELYSSDNESSIEQEVLTNSDSFYSANPDSIIFSEDLNLTEESTELTFNGVTYYLEYTDNNIWNVYKDSEHTENAGVILKLDIVSIPSSNTDFVHYNLSDRFNGYEYVDLGLPSGTKWAKMNVGANSEIDAGLYFAWGETTGYTASQVGTDKQFTWNDYTLTEDSGSTFTKYNATDNKTHLELTDDAAAVNMGGDWHIPNRAQCIELFKETKNGFVTNAGAFTQYAWSDTNGRSNPTQTTATIDNWNTAGYFFFKSDVSDMDAAVTSGDYLFVPAAGYCGGGRVGNVGDYGCVWASALDSESVGNAWYFGFDSGGAGVGNRSRFGGQPVRGVVGQMNEIEDDGSGDIK